MSDLSAAMVHGWATKWEPTLPQVVVPRGTKISPADQAALDIRSSHLSAEERAAGVTSQIRTLLDCLRSLPFDEALSVADSALRAGALCRSDLLELANSLTGRGSAQARRVANCADAKAANPFESCLRATVIPLKGFQFEPQVPVVLGNKTWHPDLVDVRRRVILEADSYSFHGSRSSHNSDCVRYNLFTSHGWLVLRFTWEHVMRSPKYVRSTLMQLAQQT